MPSSVLIIIFITSAEDGIAEKLLLFKINLLYNLLIILNIF